MECFSSGCPLEHSTLVRATMFVSTSPHVKAGRVGQLTASAEAALQKFYFRYLQGNYGWYPGDPVRQGAQCTGPQCAEVTGSTPSVTYVSGSGNGDHVRHSTCFLAAQMLAQSPAYKDRQLGDGLTISQHYVRWEQFIYDWLLWVSTNGLFRELGSAYWPRTWPTVFNLVDVPVSTRVAKRAQFFVDIALVEAVQASIAGVAWNIAARLFVDCPDDRDSSHLVCRRRPSD